jgi:hypothetical protein
VTNIFKWPINWFDISKLKGQSIEVYVMYNVQLIVYYNVIYNNYMSLHWFFTGKDIGAEQ